MIKELVRLALCCGGGAGFLVWMFSSRLTAGGALISGVGFGLCVLGVIEAVRDLRRRN